MNRKLDTYDELAVCLVGAAALATACVYDRLPARMPTHFSVHGTPNGWMAREWGAFLLPIVALVVWALLRFGGRLLPDTWRERQDASPMSIVGLLVAGLMVAVHALVLQASLSPVPHLSGSAFAVVGIFFVLLGQVLPRVRRNPFVGIRSVWTMTSDENWARTHRFAGYSMTAGGTLSALSALVGLAWLSAALILISAFLPFAYSWRLARRA